MDTPNQNQATENNLDPDFNWDAPMFGIKQDTEDVSDVFNSMQNVETPLVADTDDSDKTKEEEKPAEGEKKKDPFHETEFFKGAEENNEDVDTSEINQESKVEETEEEKAKKDKKFFTELAKSDKEKGALLYVDVPEEVTEEEYFALKRQDQELGAQEIVDSLMEGLDNDAKEFLKFKKAGGATNAFLNNYFATYTPELDMENEEDQEVAVRQYIEQVIGTEDAEEINTQIDYYKDRGKLADFAKKYYTKLKEIDDTNKKEVVKRQEDLKTKAIERQNEFINSVKTTIDKLDTVGDFSFANVNKKELGEYIYKASIKVGKDTFITPLQKKMGEVLNSEDKSKLALLAKILMSDFNVDDVIVKKTTDKTKKVENNLRTLKDGVVPEKRDYKKKDLASYF